MLPPVLFPRGGVEQSRRAQHEQVVRAIVLRRAANCVRWQVHIVRQALLALGAQVEVYDVTWNEPYSVRVRVIDPSHELTIAIDHTGTVEALVADAAEWGRARQELVFA